MVSPEQVFKGSIQAGRIVIGTGAAKQGISLAITSTPTGSEQDTSFDLPLKGLVRSVWIDVTTAEVTVTFYTLDVVLLSS